MASTCCLPEHAAVGSWALGPEQRDHWKPGPSDMAGGLNQCAKCLPQNHVTTPETDLPNSVQSISPPMLTRMYQQVADI